MVAWVIVAVVGFAAGAFLVHAFHVRQPAPTSAVRAVEPPIVHPELTALAAASMFEVNRSLQSELARARQHVKQERGRAESLSTEARTDALTGLLNRRAFDENLAACMAQWRDQRLPVSLLLIDVDRFKQLNDQHGHPAGDAALEWLAKKVRQTVRESDLAARYGGEEFAVILPAVDAAEAVKLAERLREAIAAEPLVHSGKAIRLTASIGVATAMAHDSPTAITLRADHALYAAKQNGRNRSYLHSDGECLPVRNEVVRPSKIVAEWNVSGADATQAATFATNSRL